MPKPKSSKQESKTALGRRDSAAFVSALLNPPEPNEALKAAADRYKASKALTKGAAHGMAADVAIAEKIGKGAVRAQLPVATDRRPGVRDFNAKVVGHARRHGDD